MKSVTMVFGYIPAIGNTLSACSYIQFVIMYILSQQLFSIGKTIETLPSNSEVA